MPICASSAKAHIGTFADIELTAVHGGAATTTLVRRGPAGELLGGAALAMNYATGRVVCSSMASYHAYLEFPVLLAFLSRRS